MRMSAEGDIYIFEISVTEYAHACTYMNKYANTFFFSFFISVRKELLSAVLDIHGIK